MAAYTYTNTTDTTVATNFLAGDTVTKQSGAGSVTFTGTNSACYGPIAHNGGGFMIWQATDAKQFFSLSPSTPYTTAASTVVLFKNPAGVSSYTVNANFSGSGYVSAQNDGGGTNTVATFEGTVSGLNQSGGYAATGLGLWQSGTLILKQDLPRQLNMGATAANTITARAQFPAGTVTTTFPTTLVLSTYGDVTFTPIFESSGSVAITLTGGVIKDSVNFPNRVVFFKLGGTNTGNNKLQGGLTAPANTVYLEKLGAGTWYMDGNYAGIIQTTVSTGTLVATNDNSFGAGAVTNSATIGLDGASFSFSKAINTAGTITNIAGNNSLTGTVVLAGAARFDAANGTTLTLSGASNITGAFGVSFGGAGDISVSKTVATTTASATLLKDGAGTLTLTSASNSFLGAVTINAGTVSASTLAAGGANSNIGAGTAVNFGTAGILQYTGSTAVTFNRTLAFTSATGSGFENNGTAVLQVTGAATLTGSNVIVLKGSNTAANTFSSTLTGSLAAGFSKAGAGTWIVSSNASLSGTSTIADSGTLLVTSTSYTSQKLLGSTVTVSAGARLQISSDNNQKGVHYYTNLAMGGTLGSPAKLRIGGSANIVPTVRIESGNLVLPTGSDKVTWDLSADTFRIPGIYTLFELVTGSVTGGTVGSNVTVVKPTGYGAWTFSLAYNDGVSPKTVTVQVTAA